MNAAGASVVLALLGLAALARAAGQRAFQARVRRRLPRPSGAASPARLTLRAPRWFAAALDDADVSVPPNPAWTATVVGLVCISALGAALGGSALLGLAFAAGAAGVAVVLRGRRGRATARLEHALPGALEAVARSLRSGASLRTAVDEAAAATDGRLGAELTRVCADFRRGVPFVRALDAFAERVASPGVRLTVAALGIGADTGGAQARAVDGVASTLRDRLAVAAEARALSAQTRASVWVIAVSPAVFCAFAVITDPRTADFFFRSTAGLTFLAAGLALDSAGALWMRRISGVDR
jgi:tight adherence protein B